MTEIKDSKQHDKEEKCFEHLDFEFV